MYPGLYWGELVPSFPHRPRRHAAANITGRFWPPPVPARPEPAYDWPDALANRRFGHGAQAGRCRRRADPGRGGIFQHHDPFVTQAPDVLRG
jgi:hypothetical protein